MAVVSTCERLSCWLVCRRRTLPRRCCRGCMTWKRVVKMLPPPMWMCVRLESPRLHSPTAHFLDMHPINTKTLFRIPYRSHTLLIYENPRKRKSSISCRESNVLLYKKRSALFDFFHQRLELNIQPYDLPGKLHTLRTVVDTPMSLFAS